MTLRFMEWGGGDFGKLCRLIHKITNSYINKYKRERIKRGYFLTDVSIPQISANVLAYPGAKVHRGVKGLKSPGIKVVLK